MSVSSKLPNVGTSIFAVMSKMAADFNAVNLSQGFPDFPVSEELISLVHEGMQKGFNQYSPMPGLPMLREAIAQKIYTTYSAKVNPDTEVTITAGGTQALFVAITALVEEGDEVIMFDPAYDSYDPAIRLCKGVPVHLELKPPHFGIDWEEVKQAISPKTKAIIINTPHNPTGSVLSNNDLAQLEQLATQYNLYVISDEVYEHIIFDGYEHQSVARFPKLAERSFIVYSFGKTFHATGWKLGYCVAPEKLMHEFRKTHQFQVFACNHPMQAAMAEYISVESNYNGVSLLYQQKRDLFNSLLKGSRFVIRPSAGTYFQLLDYSAISKDDDLSLAQKWTKEQKVSSIPVSVFYHKSVQNGVLRFCFAKQDETLARAAQILASL